MANIDAHKLIIAMRLSIVSKKYVALSYIFHVHKHPSFRNGSSVVKNYAKGEPPAVTILPDKDITIL
jgi:hypothetical protein